MIIPIKPILQTNTNNCLSVCLLMVLKYYDIDINLEDLERFFLKEGTTFAPRSGITDCARLAEKKGLHSVSYGLNLYLMRPDYGAYQKEELLEKLQEKQLSLKNLDYANSLESIIRCIKDGSDYIVERPSISRIKECLNAGVPIIVSLNRTVLRNLQEEDLYLSHAVVLTGVVGNVFSYIDPNYAIEEQVEEDQLFFAICQTKVIVRDAYMLAISEKIKKEMK